MTDEARTDTEAEAEPPAEARTSGPSLTLGQASSTVLTVYETMVAHYRANPPQQAPAPSQPTIRACAWCSGSQGYFTACTCTEKCEREKCLMTPFDLYDYSNVPVPQFLPLESA